MRIKRREKNTVSILKFLIVILAVLLLVGIVALISALKSFAALQETEEVDASAVEVLKAEETQDVGDVLSKMQVQAGSLEASRAASVEASQAESRSISESLFAEVSLSEAESMSEAESVRASEEAKNRVAAADEKINACLQGSHLVSRQVVYNCDDTDIPYIRGLFSYGVVIGNSRAKNAVDCGILSENEVKFQSGVSVEQITPYALQMAYLYKPKTLFVLGLNDIGYYDGSNERFYQDYLSLVRQYMAINPTGRVYLQEILPCPEEARPYFYRFFMIPDFNARIQQVCRETGAIYVSATPYADFKYINSEDHAHYGKEFYFLWAQTIATQMHLWEDMAGLGYEVN